MIISIISGDQIMMLNGTCLRETTHEHAVQCFREASSKIDVVISRMVESKLQKGNYQNIPSFFT